MSRRFRHGILIVLSAMLVAGSLAGCGGSGGLSKTGGVIKDPTLDQFFDADSLTGDFKLQSVEADGNKSFEGTGTLWLDGRRFRYSIWQDGVHLRDIMSPDGTTAYFVEVEGEYCEPSVASVDRYLAEFSRPATDSAADGRDNATGAERVVYTVQKLDDLAGAANSWYTEDITYLTMNGDVIGVLTRGDTPNDDGSPYELRTTRRIFTNLTAGKKIDPSIFVLPYPIKAVK
ncbi:MAG: hypothetical protein Q7U89_03225 [Coriobacteriia bacterium]|nr:hypothetical protein [Coriobacteriia bacterium]